VAPCRKRFLGIPHVCGGDRIVNTSGNRNCLLLGISQDYKRKRGGINQDAASLAFDCDSGDFQGAQVIRPTGYLLTTAGHNKMEMRVAKDGYTAAYFLTGITTMTFQNEDGIELDWEGVWELQRDICFLYHELAEYTGITGDLAYTLMYKLPYWDLAGAILPQMDEKEALFIRNGCLIFILAMAWEIIEGAGSYLNEHIDRCHLAVNALKVSDSDTQRLIEIVKLSLETINNPSLRDELEELSVWANQTFVRGYFTAMAKRHE
jgi:hypothetical protein